MSTVFTKPLNSIASTVGSAYTAASGSLVLATGGGAQFGVPSVASPIRVTCVRASDGAISILKVTGLTTDTLTVAGVLEGTTDINLVIGDKVEVRVSAGYLSDLHSAVNALEAAGYVTGPGGSSSQMQYNSSGAFAGIPYVTYNAAANTLQFQPQSGQGNTPVFQVLDNLNAPQIQMRYNAFLTNTMLSVNDECIFGTAGNGMGLRSNYGIYWTSGNVWFSGQDTQLLRAGPGVVKVNDGGTGIGALQATIKAVCSGTTNPIQVSNASGTLVSVVDSTGQSFGLGTATPNAWSAANVTGANLQVATTTALSPRLVLNGAGTGAPEVHLALASNAVGDRNYRYSVTATSLLFDQPSDDYSATVKQLELTKDGSVVCGPQAALAATATDGFVYIPTVAGTPTGVPASHTGTVAMHFDTTNNKLWIYNGAWKSTTLA